MISETLVGMLWEG